jgi:hypothetical protein
LIAVNGWGHAAATLRGRRYVPGSVSGLLLSQPVAALTYLAFARAGLLPAPVLAASVFLGAAYHLVPLGYLGIRRLARRQRPVCDRPDSVRSVHQPCGL